MNISCIANLIDKSRHRSENLIFETLNFVVDSLFSAHVFLCNELLDMEESFLEASFQFCISRHSSEPTYRVDHAYESIIMCGVHPIFREDCFSRDEKRCRIEDMEDEHSLQKKKIIIIITDYFKSKRNNRTIREQNHID